MTPTNCYIDARNTKALAEIIKRGWKYKMGVKENSYSCFAIYEVECGLSGREFHKWLVENDLIYRGDEKANQFKEAYTLAEIMEGFGKVLNVATIEGVLTYLNTKE